jgi:hypothetical protein
MKFYLVKDNKVVRECEKEEVLPTQEYINNDGNEYYEEEEIEEIIEVEEEDTSYKKTKKHNEVHTMDILP